MYLKFTQTGTFAWGIFIAMTVTSESKYRILSLVSQRYTYMSLHCIYFIYILYPTSIQRRDRRRKGVYFSTNKPRHEELARRIQNVWHSTKNSRKTLYLCISRRIIGLLTSDIFMKGSVPVTLPCIFDILLIKGVLTLRYDNQRINVKYIWYFLYPKADKWYFLC